MSVSVDRHQISICIRPICVYVPDIRMHILVVVRYMYAHVGCGYVSGVWSRSGIVDLHLNINIHSPYDLHLNPNTHDLYLNPNICTGISTLHPKPKYPFVMRMCLPSESQHS